MYNETSGLVYTTVMPKREGKVFKNKNEIPLLTYFTIKVNLSETAKWTKTPAVIKPCSESDWRDDEFKEYQITLLPFESFTFYHNQANEFSPSIGGMDIIEDKDIGCIEWAWTKSHFYINVSDPRITIFSAPLDEIFHLMKTGNNLSKKAIDDQSVISLGGEEMFDEILVNKSPNYALRYSNHLASLMVVSASANDLVNY